MISRKTFLIVAAALCSSVWMGNQTSLQAQTPETYRVKMVTTRGTFHIDVTRNWCPNGADQFYKLVQSGFYNNCAFFRVIDGFMAQFGINGDPEIQKKWRGRMVQGDPVVKSNLKGYVSFAKTGAPHSRTTQIFINYADNRRLDGYGFAPFGFVSQADMKIVEALYSGYGEGSPAGRGPTQSRIQYEGNHYLKREFPRLDYIINASIVDK